MDESHTTQIQDMPPELEAVAHAEKRVRSSIPVIQQLGVALGILLLIFGSTVAHDVWRFFTKGGASDAEADVVVIETTPTNHSNHFDTIVTTATSVFVWDVREQRALYNKDADKRLPLASVTKLMTALLAHELLDAGEAVIIPPEAILQSGDSGLSSGEQFDLTSLTDLTLITSSNDGAFALASAAGDTLSDTPDAALTFVRAMNIRAEEIGLTQTRFSNPTGLDLSPNQAGAYGSARDMAFLMEYLLLHYPELLETTTKETLYVPDADGATHLAHNTNDAVSKIPGLLASKTGYTDLAGGNLVVAFNAGLNRPIIISVLGSTREGRFDDVLTLVDRATKQVLYTE
ncbi:D-alanyl-D-alanine carboxypeptidase [Candidatus Kaiserbacteria bacterium]|nr:D-alanyl-D-alanine carboxypeptidase [Candidatus Kaiserbacteria bacterium]